MTEEVRLHLERADDCLKDAEILVNAQRPAAAVGRGYYAMFHAASAVLLQEDIKRSSHQGIISAFGQFLVKSGRIEQKFHRHFREAFDLRQQSDYEPIIDITIEQTRQVIQRAGEFVEACRGLLR